MNPLTCDLMIGKTPMSASEAKSTTGRDWLRARLPVRLRRFLEARDGAAAIEFAFVVPIMLVMLFGTFELSQAIETNKKAGRGASLIADLVTQQAVITKNEVVAIAELGAAALAPYNRDNPVVEIVGVQVTNEPTPRALVVWSQRVQNGSGSRFLTVGSSITIPSELMIRNTFIVKAGLRVAYYPATAHVINSTVNSRRGIQMGETYHLRPRTSPTVACPDC
jgi:Flp pilus assembly protein TadG